MSVEQMSLVWKKQLSEADQHTLLALADHAHDDGSNVRPSVAHLSWKLGISERTIQRRLKSLHERGALVLVKEAYAGRPREWKLDLSIFPDKRPWAEVREEIRQSKREGCQSVTPDTGVTPTPDTGVTPRGDTAVSPKPSVQPSMNHTSEDGEVPETAPSPIKVINVKGWIVKQLMDRVNAARDRGARILKPTDDQRKTLASITEANWKDYEVDEFLNALDYMVAKAAGEVDGQPAAWCYIGTALDAINDGWKPGDSRASRDEPLNPQSDKAIALRDKPNAAGWYEAFYDVDTDTVERLLKKHATHSAMLDALERGVVSA